MQITSAVSTLYRTTTSQQASSRGAVGAAAATPGSTTDSGGGVSSYDFTNMTPKQLLSTVNDLVKSGKLSLVDSSPLLTIAGFANGGGIGGAAAEGANKPMDVLSALQAGISYKQQNQGDMANSGIHNWTNALTALQNLQGTPSGVDTYA